MSDESILVVDDNPMNLTLLQAMLAARGYAVRTASGGQEALVTLEQTRPRLILMDLQMPGIDGFELTRRLKADATMREIPIIAVTAFAMSGDEARARAAGCDDYVSKPIDRRLLYQLIEKHLAAGS
jgi:two-component system cell cycle response regulator DivK